MDLQLERRVIANVLSNATGRLGTPIVALCLLLACTTRTPTDLPQVHHVRGGVNEVFANAYIVEGETGVVVVDAQLTRSGSRALREQIDGFGKRLLAIVLTHGHPDHYGGVAQLVAGLGATPVVALAGVDAVIRRDDAVKGGLLQSLGVDWAEPRTFPNVIAEGGVDLTFGDISLSSLDVGEAESDHDSVWVLRAGDAEHLFVGDLVMSGVHAYTADAHTGRWLAALARLELRLRTAVRIYPGHGEPGGVDLVRNQIGYLERFRSEVWSLSGGRPSLSPDEIRELETRMVRFLGHDRMARWIHEGANPVAEELTAAEFVHQER